MSTIPSPFTRTDVPTDDDVENHVVLDFDEYQKSASGPILVCNALSKDERNTLFSGDGERNSLSELSPINLSFLPTQTTLQLHGEARIDGTEPLCCAFSENGPFLASGCRNGSTLVYRLPDSLGSTQETLQLHQVYEIQSQDPSSPVTSLAWLNTSQDTSFKYILASAQAGSVNVHHVPTQRLLTRASLQHESTTGQLDSSKSILTLSGCPKKSQLLAAGGSDGSVVLYDNSGSTLVHTGTLTVPGSQSGGGTAQAHSSRVLALEWHPQDSNLLCSGGWDLTVKMWDVRMQRPALTIEGPYICGQGVAFNPEATTLATAAWRAKNPLQLWDIRTGQFRTNVPLSSTSGPTTTTTSAANDSKSRAEPNNVNSSSSNNANDGSLRLFCVSWMTQDTLMCAGSGGGGCVQAVRTDGSAIATAPSCGVAVDVCRLNSSATDPMAAVATSAGLCLLGCATAPTQLTAPKQAQ